MFSTSFVISIRKKDFKSKLKDNQKQSLEKIAKFGLKI